MVAAATRRLIAALAASLLIGPGSAGASTLDEQEALGKQIYMTGTGVSADEPVTVFIGEEQLALPASVAPCSSCHGADGRGRPEGGVIPSDITWANLTKPYGHKHAFGRSHGAYDEASVAAAIVTGVDPAGNRFGEAMPLYSLGEQEMAALIAYLKRLESDPDPGLEAQTLRIATLLPTPGAQDSLGQAMAAAMLAFVDRLNAQGGVFNRKLALEVIPLDTQADDPLSGLEQALDEGGIFALVAPYAVGREAQLSEMVERRELPAIGVFTSAPPAARALDRYAFYLYAGPAQRQRLLLEHATGELGIAMDELAAVRDSVDPLPAGMARIDVAPGAEAGMDLARAVVSGEARGVFYSGSAQELAAMMRGIATRKPVPYLFVSPELVTPALFQAPPAFHQRVLLAYPSLPSDIDDSGRALYADLAADHALSRQHVSAQVAALAAMKLFVEGAKRAGRDLSRDKLVLELEALENFRTGLAPPLSFNLNRRIGALGAHIVALDLDARTLVPVGPWREVSP